MKRLTFALLLTAAAALADKPGTWTGIITDSMCKENHAHMGATDHEKCVRECVKSDPKRWKYVLSDGKNTYRLSDQALPEKFAAKKVTVKGTLYEKTGVIKVDSIVAAN